MILKAKKSDALVFRFCAVSNSGLVDALMTYAGAVLIHRVAVGCSNSLYGGGEKFGESCTGNAIYSCGVHMKATVMDALLTHEVAFRKLR